MKKVYNYLRHFIWLFRYCALIVSLLLIGTTGYSQQGKLLVTDKSQKDFLNAYKLIITLSDHDYRSTSKTMDTILFPKYGEYSIYWITSGPNKGSFVIPDTLPANYKSVNTIDYSDYKWADVDQRSIQVKKTPKQIAIFRSKIEVDGHSISWEAQYFNNLFKTFLFNEMVYFVNEDDIINNGISDSTTLLIIPAFNVHASGNEHYVDSMFTVSPSLKNKITTYLSKGGNIYTEGNAAYFIQKAGIGITVNFGNTISSTGNNIKLSAFSTTNPIAFAHSGTDDNLYCSTIPKVDIGTGEAIAKCSDNRPAIFELSGDVTNGGRVICNLGIPTVGGIAEVEGGSRQLQWTLNAIFDAFSHNVDLTRSVFNVLPPELTVGHNAISYDRIDSFDVNIKIRNLSSNNISNLTFQEDLRKYFTFVKVISSVGTSLYNNGSITFSGINVPPHSEITVSYTIATPEPSNNVHSSIDKLIDSGTLMAASLNTSSYTDNEGKHQFTKTRNYADVMFSARIFGDADVNWKNFLNLEYQPFKVFMIMENKERTAAKNTVYTQYIPKDIPFYWSNKAMDIPILRTPGGKFVDVLKGSTDQNKPEYDMDGDGKPDAWLDTTSIFPKGYQIVEDSVYWLNPWTHVYEDINHDGIIAQDTNGDGIIDVQAPGDKIRVWKVTWNIGDVKGYDYFDPYCSYEVWVDPPDLVKMAAGVGYVKGTVKDKFPGMFFPYTKDIATANINDNSWKHWMEWDDVNNKPVDKQFILQNINNYSGYTFVDDSYKINSGWETLIGEVPQPHEEFIAVVSLGGEEIDMYHPTPKQSLYSKINYETIFKEKRVTPIRTTYTYYAPLPNPLQFEYLGSTFSATDTLNKPITYLPANGKAKLNYDLDASTEYSYYWIRNVGHKVMYNDPSLAMDGDATLGDGVFGYMIYEIPKGMGGYSITLPKKADGTYDTDAIVSVDNKPFAKWLDNKNTGNSIEIWEDPFRYQIYVPQLLIPPALCDKNGDGIDDWRDDTGDRFESGTGFLHDQFMKGDGTWQAGADNVKGSDQFDDLGKAHFTFHALYEGQGKEGPVDISKGGTLVVEEIFGGSPWVIFSHALTAYAKGVDLKITSEASPSSVKYGLDSIWIKHTIEDINEPNVFDEKFDPYHVSVGYTTSAITSLAGGKDPCSLVDPAISTSTLIDPKVDKVTITLVPGAGTVVKNNPDLDGFPKSVSGIFLQVKVEVMNGTDDNWINTAVTPVLSGLGNTKAVLTYVAYPRPLVPAHIDNGVITPGDQPGTFTTGWRFNQPEGEVLVKMGNTLNLMQPTRRGYFIFLFSIDESLKSGIYDIGFTLSGTKKHYTGQDNGNVSYAIPSVKFSIIEKSDKYHVKEYQKIKIDNATLTNLTVNGSNYFQGLNKVKWSAQDVNFSNFDGLTTTLQTALSDSNRVEVIDLSKVKNLPNADTSKLYILEKVKVNSYRAGENIDLTTGEKLYYSHNPDVNPSVPGNKIVVSPYGPRILISQTLYSVNDVLVGSNVEIPSDQEVHIATRLNILNAGTDVSTNTKVSFYTGSFYTVIADKLPKNATFDNGLITVNIERPLVPGDTSSVLIYYTLNQTVTTKEDLMTVINLSNISYQGTSVNSIIKYSDPSKVLFSMYDFQLKSLEYTKISDTEYEIKVLAINRGLPASNIWLRLYPAIGGGISELPIAEKKIASFATGQEVELDYIYTLHNSELVQMYAKIDDGDLIAEAIEKNNSLIKDITSTVGLNELKSSISFKAYPNPFSDHVCFSYNLKSDVDDINLSVYTASGVEVIRFINCPVKDGNNSIDWYPVNLASGNYIYKLIVANKSGKSSVIPGLLIKTER